MNTTPVTDPNKGALSNGMWTVMERVISQIGQLIIFVTAARVLTPAQFGVFALTSACAILLLRFAEVGWAQYIMSWSGSDETPRKVLFIAIIFGFGAACLGMTVGLGFTVFEATPDAGILIMLFAGWVFLATTSSAQKGILVWQNKIRASAICEILGELTGLAVALVSLLSGFGVLALVFGRIAMQSVHLGLSFAFTRLTPKPGMTAEQFRHLKDYSIPLFTSRMIVNFRLYAATFIIGGFLGAAAVGYYRAAERLVSALSEVVAVPSQVLAWSLFRQTREVHNGTLAGFQKEAETYFHILFLTALPIFVWVSVFAKDLINGLLGPEWQPAIPIVVILALARAISLPSFASEPILSLAGEIRRLPKFAFLFLLATLILNLIASPFGMVAVAWAQVAGSIIVTVCLLWLTKTYGTIVWKDVAFYSRRIIPPLVLATVVLILLRDTYLFAEMPGLLRIVAASIPTLIVYGIALCLFDQNIWNGAKSYFSRVGPINRQND